MSTTKPDPIRHLWLMHTPGLVWLRPLSALENKPPTVEISRHRFSISYTNLMWSWPSGACSWLHFWLWSLLWPHLHVLTSPSSQQSDHGFPLGFLAQHAVPSPWLLGFPMTQGSGSLPQDSTLPMFCSSQLRPQRRKEGECLTQNLPGY